MSFGFGERDSSCGPKFGIVDVFARGDEAVAVDLDAEDDVIVLLLGEGGGGKGDGQADDGEEDGEVDLGITGALSKRYIPADVRRIEAYRRLSNAGSLEELDKVERDITTAYGDPPARAQPLFELAAIRIAATQIGVKSIRRHEGDIIFRTSDPTALGARMEGAAGSLRLVGQPDSEGRAEVYYRPPSVYLEPESLLTVLRRRLTGQTVKRATSEPAAAH